MKIKLPAWPRWREEWHGKFLWLPRFVDGHIVWLESVWRRGSYYDQLGWEYTYKLTVPKEI